jgi:hypothetical protein
MRASVVGTALLFVAAALFAQTRALSELDFVVTTADAAKSLRLSDSAEEIEYILGRPLDIRIRQRATAEPDFVQYIYRGLIVGFYSNDRKVTLLRITGPEFVTTR